MRFIDFFKEESQDMTKIKHGRENSNSLSSPSSPWLLISRWLSSLPPRLRFASSAASSSKRKRDADDKIEMLRNRSKTVVGSLVQIAPENEEALEFVFAGVDHGQRITGETEYEELMRDSGKEGKQGSHLLSGSIDGVKDICTFPLKEAGKCNKPILKNSKVKSCGSLEDVATCSASSDRVVLSGKCIDEASFNLGIGVGLAFLIANSKNEFHKLKELQKQMEMLLGDIKNEMQRKDRICPDSKNNLASNSNGSKCTEDHLDVQSHGSSDCLVMEVSTMECGQFSKSDLTEGSAKGVGMDQLEAELEAELERLQLKLDAENTSELRRKQCVKIVVKNIDMERSISPCFELECNPQESHSREYSGISPNELERRLHELLESRQREQIAELESALEYAERKLHEKEMEICWWKDNVQFLLHHKD
ncbi:hypothetical protein MRB53_009065 [Persea americana]|uniref:Uncharacterized protein n=1 Tax=Persea americana TaxID=3435 RepID=A0ACC2LNQ4_PERAE|nr:hypothetical protein MRB53_009065 [Persea americana]